MADTTFVNGTAIVPVWLNEVNGLVHKATQSGVGAVARTGQSKLNDVLNVRDFGAVGNGIVNDAPAFNAAINALPAAGGKIVVPSGTWLMNTEPTWGAKNMYWDIDVAAVFTGAGATGDDSFPRARTNVSMLPVGPFIQSQSTVISTANNATGALVVEALVPAGTNNGAVGIYAAADGPNNGGDRNLWATNFLAYAQATSTKGVYGCEIDINCYATSGFQYGLDITGLGTTDPTAAIEIQRADSTRWKTGIELRNSIIGINLVGSGMSRGITINTGLVFTNSLISGSSLANNSDMLTFTRNTDTAPTGTFLKLANAANTVVQFQVDVTGNLTSVGSLNGLTVSANGPAVSSAANVLRIGNVLTTSATAGGASALPANPTQYLTVYHGTTLLKIPMYSA